VNYEFDQPDFVRVGTRGEVGSRVFLLQIREGKRLVVIKCEKTQLSALANWLVAVLDAVGRPGHLPEDLGLEPSDEWDLVAGEIAVGFDEDLSTIDLTIESNEEDGDSVDASLSKEQAAALAIEITRLVEAGRPPCPLCGFPLDARGHDCPRTNGHRAPLR
jgi:uncharacterized repeat protein (TIGR03847 family)